MSASVVCVHLCIGRLMQLTCCLWYAIAGSFPSQLACCFLCKHQNVIKTNRSGFLISVSFYCCAVSHWWNQEERFDGWVFIFIICTIWCTIYAFMRLVTQQPTTTKVYWKWKFMALCLALYFADYISLMMALAFPTRPAAPSEKHKARAFVCTIFLIRGLRAEIRCCDNLDFPDRFYKKLLFFGDDKGGKNLLQLQHTRRWFARDYERKIKSCRWNRRRGGSWWASTLYVDDAPTGAALVETDREIYYDFILLEKHNWLCSSAQ